MATIRRAGFGSVFEVENEKVGIGTTGTATNTLQVLENVKSSDAKIIGLSTLTTYQGFVDKEAKFGDVVIDVEFEGGTLGDVIIDGDFNVSSASTFRSSVNQLTLTDSFSVPTGNTDSRIHCQTAGSMRFNEDLGTLEFYTGDMWKVVNSIIDNGRGRGFLAGGTDGTYTSAIQSFQISTLGNTTMFGDIITAKVGVGCASDGIRGIFGGGTTPSAAVNEMDYIAMASEGDGIDFGNLTQARYSLNGVSSSTRGVFAGGWVPNNTNVIDYVEIQTLGDALDFGDLSEGGNHGNPAMQSPTRGIWCGGYGSFTPDVNSPYAYNRMQLITIASKGNTLDFGDLTIGGARGGAGGNSVRGVYAGGIVDSQINKVIEFVTIASTGNGTVFGDLTIARRNSPECNDNATRAVFCAGIADDGTAPAHTNYMDYITIASEGNAQDFGDVLHAGKSNGGISDSHGGLGGF